VTSLLTSVLNLLAALLPGGRGFGHALRASAPASGTVYQVRSRVRVPVVLLPLTPPVRRFEISLAPTTQIRIAAATRPDEEHVYAHLEMSDPASIFPASERTAALATGFLLEVPRRILRSQFVIA